MKKQRLTLNFAAVVALTVGWLNAPIPSTFAGPGDAVPPRSDPKPTAPEIAPPAAPKSTPLPADEGVHAHWHGRAADAAFERFVDLEALANALRNGDPGSLIDEALQLAEAERILQRRHKAGVTAASVLHKATLVAARKRDAAALDRLTRAAEKASDQELLAQIRAARKAMESAGDAGMQVSLDEMDAEGFAVLKNLADHIGRLELFGDEEALKSAEKHLAEAKELPAIHKEALKRRIAKARESLGKPQSLADVALSKLAAPSRWPNWKPPHVDPIPHPSWPPHIDPLPVINHTITVVQHEAGRIDPSEAVRNEFERASQAAVRALPKLNQADIFQNVQSALQQNLQTQLAKRGVRFNANTGDVDLRFTPMGATLSKWLYDFAQGQQKQGGVSEFNYNLKSEQLTLSMFVRHHQVWNRTIPGLGQVNLYDVTQRASFDFNFRTGSGNFTIDLGPLVPKITSTTLERLEKGDLVGIAQDLTPAIVGNQLHHEEVNQFDQRRREYEQRYGAGNVYISSFPFVKWAEPGTFVNYVLDDAITGESTLYPQIMSAAWQQAQAELPRLGAWLEARGLNNAQSAALTLLSGKTPPWPFIKFELFPVQFSSRDRPLNSFSTRWININHLAFAVIWENGSNPGVHPAPALQPTTTPTRAIYAKNNASFPIWVAADYRFQGQWRANGFWKVEPGQQTLLFRTDDPTVYFYGEGPGKRIKWQGSALHQMVRGESYGFLEQNAGTGGGSFTMNFNYTGP